MTDGTKVMPGGGAAGLDLAMERLPKAAAVFAAAAGALALAGWLLDLPALKSVFPGLLPMKVNTALGCILAGAALWSDCSGAGARLCCRTSKACAWGVLLLGLLTMAEFASGRNLGIDQALLRETAAFPGTVPGRMTFTAAVNFSLLGAALLFLRREGAAFVRAVNVLGVLICAGAVSNVLLYTYEFHTLYHAVQHYTPMALNTALVFLALGFALLNARAHYPFRRLITSDTDGGYEARRLLPIALAFPLLTAWLVLKWHQADYLDEGSSFAVFALCNLAGFTALIQWNSSRLLELNLKRELAAEDLRRYSAELKDLYNNAPCGYHSVDKDGYFVRVNDTELAWLGYSRAELLTEKKFADLLTPGGAERFRKNFETFKQQGYIKDLEYDLLRKDGTPLKVLISATAVTDPDGSYVMSRSTVYDITELERSRSELERLNRMHTVLGEINEAIIRAKTPAELYEKACRIMVEDGLFRLAWIGLVVPATGEVAPAARFGHDEGYLDSLHVSIDKEKPEGRGPTGIAIRECRHYVNNDTRGDLIMTPWRERALERGYRSSASFPLLIDGAPFGAFTLYASEPGYFKKEELRLLDQLAADISFSVNTMRTAREKETAEALLRHRETGLREAQRIARLGSWELNLAANRLSWSEEIYRIFELDPAGFDASYEAFLNVIHPDDRRAVDKAYKDSLADKRPYAITHRLLMKDGRIKHVHERCETFYSEDGRPLRSAGTVHDITEQKKVEEELKTAVTYNRSLIEASLDPLVTIDAAGRITDVNAATESAAGLPREALIGTDFSDYFTEPDRAREGYRRVLKAGFVRDYPLTLCRKDGRTMDVSYNASVYRDPGGAVTGVFAAARDVTELKLAEKEKLGLESQLQQAHKMEAVGRLAGGIAHDFNNLLTAVLGYTDCLLTAMPQGDPNRPDLEEVKKAGERGAVLTRQLLAFSRRQVLQPRVLDLNPLVRDMEKLLNRLIGENIELNTRLAPGLGRIKADLGQLEQVVMNLAVNARDAMPAGGKLMLETENVELGADYTQAHPGVAPGDYVALKVSDTGNGMPPEVLKHLFEPFFTTKPQGKGTGLGLATVYGIVKQSGGSVSAYSEPGKGTSFKVYLPRVEAYAENAAEVRPARTDLHGKETVLLVEDDESIRKLAHRILTTSGYKVLCASCPEEAVRLSETREEAIQLMLTDVVMPHMNGRQLSDLLAPANPGMKVLFMSGYTHDIIEHQGLLEPGLVFIEKPFTPEGLLEKVKAALGEAAAVSGGA